MRLTALLMLFVIIGISSALILGPKIYEQDDLGDPMFGEFTYSISVDCTAASITTIVMNESNTRVQGANAYLKYVDFSTPLMGAGTSDKDGLILFRLPGDVKLMRGLFILVIEKKGYRSKEVHFDISPCFTNTTNPAPPSKPPANNSNNTQLPGNGTGQNNTNQTQPQQNDTNETGENNETGDGTDAGNETGGELCAPAFALPLLLMMFFKRTRRNRIGGVGG
ncbi:MAG: hypothetical protein PHF60_04535 [Candidatus ainarchaeum sp.]|nr:hypothetical protein [Candidatus ainarchaeum sp.]